MQVVDISKYTYINEIKLVLSLQEVMRHIPSQECDKNPGSIHSSLENSRAVLE